MSDTLAVNVERHFQVVVTPCLITKKFDRCIQVKLGTIVLPPEAGQDEGKVVEVTGAFSRAGLEALQRDLESVPDPIGLPSQEAVRETTPYQWAVVLEDGEHFQQYPAGGGETPFAMIHLPDVAGFWILPRAGADVLPWYGLIRGEGWFMRQPGGYRKLDLPHPGSEPFEWHYYRSTSLTFGLGGGQAEALPPHIIQVLGWRIGETVFEIGVEFDGNWQVWKRQPMDDPRWEPGIRS